MRGETPVTGKEAADPNPKMIRVMEESIGEGG